MIKLNISPKLSLPADAVTSTIVIYGGKGMGKTSMASVLVEEFAANDLRFAVLDPMGVWHGLRYSSSGKGPGIKVLILGGIHGDLPITPESGALVADLVVDEDASVVIDISRRPDGSMWAISERIRFVRDYAKRIYQRQGEKRRPLALVIDEAARFAPQIVRHGEGDVAACMGAIAVLVEEGRNVGIGVTLVTQRSARLNKDVAELADCMIAFRTVGPNSMSAVLDWLGEHVEKSRLKAIGEQLRSLPRGSALVVSPGWLEFEGVVAMRARETFDSSATPKAGERALTTGPGAKVNLAKYRERLSTLIEEQKANDPKALKARVAELEKELAKKGKPVPNKVVDHVVDKPAVNKAAIVAIERAVAAGGKVQAQASALTDRAGQMMQKAAELMAAASLRFEAEVTKLRSTIAAATSAQVHVTKVGRTRADIVPVDGPLVQKIIKDAARPGTAFALLKDAPAEMTGPERRIIEAIAWLNAIGVEQPPIEAVAFLADYRPGGGAFNNTRGKLRAKGFVNYPTPGSLELTDTGRAIAPNVEIGSGAALRDAVMSRLDGPERRVLAPLIAAYPDPIGVDHLATESGYEAGGGAFNNTRGRLRTLGLAEYPKPGLVRAADLLFPDHS
jgi:uncharacterized protein